MTKVRLPAVEIEVPRMGNIVYVSPRIGVQDDKWTTMFTAEIVVDEHIELQSFHLKCKNRNEAKTTTDRMMKDLEKHGPYPFIQHGI